QPHIKAGNLKLRNDSAQLYKMLNEFPYQKKDGPDALDMAVRTILYDNNFSTYSPETLKQKGFGQPKNELMNIKKKQWDSITKANTERLKKLMGK
ncbi:MAG TPA: hypothetical protein PKK05_23675, partial [Leptospiraceae bacterium]|nr:hypothetical protein [Leptospiraceae bacterium]